MRRSCGVTDSTRLYYRPVGAISIAACACNNIQQRQESDIIPHSDENVGVSGTLCLRVTPRGSRGGRELIGITGDV